MVQSEKLYEFFSVRGISRETVDEFGCYLGRRKFGDRLGVQDCIVFQYRFKGEVVNRKYRCLAEKDHRQEADALPTLFNVDSVKEPDVVWWVEGESDVLALAEIGYRQTVSLKDGAPKEARSPDDPKAQTDTRYDALTTHVELLGQVKKFILAGDMDKPGLALREEVARRLGRQRCWVVTWPEGCKDACDVLRTYGKEALQDALEAAAPYPIDGVHKITGALLDVYLGLPAPPTLTTGTKAVDSILKLPGEGRLIVVTGIPNSGKSPFLMSIMIHMMKRHDRRFVVFSPEMEPFEEYAVMCAQALVGKPARRVHYRADLAVMTREERLEAGEWLKPRMAFLASDGEFRAPSLDWVLERAADCVMRLGSTDLVIDPINEVDQDRKGMSEAEYGNRMLQRCKAFTKRHGANVFIVAHPTKMRPEKPGQPLPVPGPYDISGGAHWYNKADLGFTVHRPDEVTEIHLWKAKFHRWGRKGSMAKILYDVETCRYMDMDLADKIPEWIGSVRLPYAEETG